VLSAFCPCTYSLYARLIPKHKMLTSCFCIDNMVILVSHTWLHCPHNPKVVGSNTTPAIQIKALKKRSFRAFTFCLWLRVRSTVPIWLHSGLVRCISLSSQYPPRGRRRPWPASTVSTKKQSLLVSAIWLITATTPVGGPNGDSRKPVTRKPSKNKSTRVSTLGFPFLARSLSPLRYGQQSGWRKRKPFPQQAKSPVPQPCTVGE
jgi:hypothetical protein